MMSSMLGSTQRGPFSQMGCKIGSFVREWIEASGSFNEPCQKGAEAVVNEQRLLCGSQQVLPYLLVGVKGADYLDFTGFLGRFWFAWTPQFHIMKVYLRGQSFSEVNARLEQGRTLIARDYSLLRQGIEFTLGEDLPDGVKVAIFKKIQNGFPFAHDFGTYCATTHRLINRTKTSWGRRSD